MTGLPPTDAPSILMVEDDPLLRDTLAEMLQDAGYSVTTATNGMEALAVLRDGAPVSVILLDLMMPIMDGWQFRAEQQKDAALAAIPVIVLTADGRAPQKASALDAAGGLAKPVDLDDLLAAVAPYLP